MASVTIKQAPGPNSLAKALLDPGIPMDARLEMVRQLVTNNDQAGLSVISGLLNEATNAQNGTGEQLYKEKLEELAAYIEQLGMGPLRLATVLAIPEKKAEPFYTVAKSSVRVKVVAGDGQHSYPVVTDEAMLADLKCGDDVWMDSNRVTILCKDPADPRATGRTFVLDRFIPEEEAVVLKSSQGAETFLAKVSDELLLELTGGGLQQGAEIIANPVTQMAYRSVPTDEEPTSKYRFLSTDRVPDVDLERDVADPAPFISELGEHVHREMTQPGLSTRYRLRKSIFRLLTGPPGTGKTFSISASWNLLYRTMSEVTGVPVEQLPPRVLHLRGAELLSKWFGESDRNIAQFFDEVEAVANEEFVTPEGKSWKLPVLVIAEEVESMARERGGGSGEIHDRLMATLLQRMDPARDVFRDNCVCLIATTNSPGLVDRAVVRRIGGTMTHFGAPSREAFRAILAKQFRDRPFGTARQKAATHEVNRNKAADALTEWMYAEDQPALLELTFAGTSKATKLCYGHDFITPALVDRAVQEASAEACRAEWSTGKSEGLTAQLIGDNLSGQIDNIVKIVEPSNADQYLTLPEDMRVAAVSRLH